MTESSGERVVHRPKGVRHFLSGTGSGYLERLVAIVAGIATLPIGIGAYGAAAYGVWITATSISQYFSSGSLGMPMAVMTAVSSAPDRERAARVAGHGLRVAVGGAVAMLSAGVAVWLLAPGWAEALFGGEATASHVVSGVVVFLAGTALLQPFQIYSTVLAGRHRVVARNAYTAASTVGRLAALLVASTVSESLLVLAAATVVTEAAVTIVRSLHVTITERIPVHRYVLDRSARHEGLISSGMRFFALQVETTVIRNTDNIVISAIIGASAVSYYAAPLRMISAATGLIGAMQGPLWPAYGSAHRNGEWDWIANPHRIVTALGLTLGGAAWIGVTGFAEPVVALWLGADFPYSQPVVFLLGAYAFIAAWNGTNAILLNALDATRSQVLSAGAEAVVNIASSIALARIFGPAGVAAGTAIGATCVSSWLLPIDVRRKTSGRVSPNLGKLLAVAAFTVPLALVALWIAGEHEGATRYVATAGVSLLHVGACLFIFRDLLAALRRLRKRAPGG